MKTMITLKIEPDQGKGECEEDDQMIMVITAKVMKCSSDGRETFKQRVSISLNQFQDKLSLPSLKLSLPEGVGEGELFVNNKSLTLAELNGESPCLLSVVEAEKNIQPEVQSSPDEKIGPEIVEVSHFQCIVDRYRTFKSYCYRMSPRRVHQRGGVAESAGAANEKTVESARRVLTK